MKKKFEGFTLIELLVVVAVIGTLAAVGVYSYNGYIKSSKKTSAKNTMMQIGLAQTEYYSNSGFYWYNGLNDDDDTSCADEKSTKKIGSVFFEKEGYIDASIDYHFCIVADSSSYTVRAISTDKDDEGKNICILTLDESGVVDDSNC